jgi:hypothetical protein
VLEATAPFAVQVVREFKPDKTADVVVMGEGFAVATMALFHSDLDVGLLQSLANILIYWRVADHLLDEGTREGDMYPSSVDCIGPVRVFRILVVDAQDDVPQVNALFGTDLIQPS